ncbi:hypothetical protein OR16_21848 [Cupriavidus basilensis OR16]|uniref:Uncharacterized protein n=1 Tax=Cupriavidus basilensis OR16 TaxID=1127483 RepID=H1S8P8_9BURK|nr:hypothetical protein [Cupriavidus basilensis]EHP41090.1 hypothetical protein OR16_21848 [Cupriavidus basilensis OR16]
MSAPDREYRWHPEFAASEAFGDALLRDADWQASLLATGPLVVSNERKQLRPASIAQRLPMFTQAR